MAKFLRVLLDAKEPAFTTSLRQLEGLSGQKGIDITYIADITHRAHSIMRMIGLDPADTTKLELYRALNAHSGDEHLFKDTADVGLCFDDEIVSFNIEDIRANEHATYDLRTVEHMRCQIAHVLVERYAQDAGDRKAVDKLAAEAGLDQCDLTEYHEQRAVHTAAKDAPYVLCIGDIFTDVFIKLIESEARIDKDPDGSERLSIPFGSKPPYERADIVTSVGPSPNAAVSIARLGARVGLMSWLGDDQTGKDSLNYLAHEKIDTAPTTVQRKTLSNTYYVLRYGADRTILVKNEDYNYKWEEPKTKPDWIYLSLISADSWPLHLSLADYLEEHQEIKFALQPGTFHFKWGAQKLARLYKRAEIVVMNREEAVDVTGGSYDDLKGLADKLHELGPKCVVITDGAKGSYASHDGKLVAIPNYPDPAPPVDRTGAGDAFASTIVAGLALGKDFETALTWAPINSMNVVQNLGAQAGLLRASEVENYLSEAPADYKVQEYRP